jgi:hypothetical protein
LKENADPVASGMLQVTDVCVDHVVVRQASQSVATVGVKSPGPKFRPRTVIGERPDAAPFAPHELPAPPALSTGALKENTARLVPSRDPTEVYTSRPAPTYGDPTHWSCVVDVQEVHEHATTCSWMELDMSAPPKFSPFTVKYRPPLEAWFHKLMVETKGASNECIPTIVPIALLAVTATGCLEPEPPPATHNSAVRELQEVVVHVGTATCAELVQSVIPKETPLTVIDSPGLTGAFDRRMSVSVGESKVHHMAAVPTRLAIVIWDERPCPVAPLIKQRTELGVDQPVVAQAMVDGPAEASSCTLEVPST